MLLYCKPFGNEMSNCAIFADDQPPWLTQQWSSQCW